MNQDELELPKPTEPPQRPASIPLTLDTLERVLDHREHQARMARQKPVRDYLSLVTWADLEELRHDLFFRLEMLATIGGFLLGLNLLFVFIIFLILAARH